MKSQYDNSLDIDNENGVFTLMNDTGQKVGGHAMIAFEWRGNVREVENVIERLTILCDNPVVAFDDLPENIQESHLSIQPAEEVILDKELNLQEAVRDYEKRIILEALEKSNWIKSKAAKLLNINRTTLVAKIKTQNLEDTASF